VVSGPWTLGKWERGSTVTLVPNPAYTGERPPTLRRVILKVVPEYATRLIELESGSVDMIESIQTIEDIGRLKRARPNLTLHHRGQRFLDYVAWNLGDPLFAEREVRQALTMAVDRQKLVRDLLTASTGETFGVEAVSWITPELCDVQASGLQPFPHDPARARAILAEHGWRDTNGDGVVDRGGVPFRFELLTNAGNARRAKAVIIIQAMLKGVGVDAQVAQVESNAFFERMRKRDYRAALSGWSAGLFVDPIEIWHSDQPGHRYEFNFTGYSNPEADALMEEGMRTADPAAANEIWKRLQQVIHDDQPYTYLFWRDEVVPLDSRFRDVKVDILSYLRDVNEWWVPADQMKYGR
jgi:peptide/nickel transport system substrate-binding protein